MGNFKKVDFAFSVIPNKILDDKNLSWTAKGVYSHLASKPDGWQFACDRIAKNGTEGIFVIRKAIRELIAAGYLESKRENTGRIQYLLFSTPQKKATVQKLHCAKTALLSKKDLNNKKKSLCEVAIAPQRKTKKPMKKYQETTIELDELGERKEPTASKSKTPLKVITAVAVHYADTFNVPKSNLFFKYRRAIEEMVTCAKEYYGEDFKKIEAEIKLRITVAKAYADFKGWGKIKLATIAESWNEIPGWKEQIEV